MTHQTRKSLRLENYDYAIQGGYFFTICLKDRAPIFGEVENDVTLLNRTGASVTDVWLSLPVRFPAVELDESILMPDHFHGILFLSPPEILPKVVGASLGAPEANAGAPRDAPTLGTVVGAFKSLSARAINQILNRTGPVWQRNYFERVIRNEAELTALREYIRENPIRWSPKKVGA